MMDTLDCARGSRLPVESFPCGRVLLATRLSSRLRGMLFSPESEDVLVLMPCHDIHTFGMRYAIDVAFLGRDGRVRTVVRDVMPNKRLRDSRAVAVLERRAMPREVWFEEGDSVALGHFRRTLLPRVPAVSRENDKEEEHENVSDLQSALLR